MKLKSFNAENSASAHKTGARVHINHSSGVFTLSDTAVNTIGLAAGDTVELHQDEEQPKDWYITKSEKGFKLRDKNKDAKGMLCFNNVSVARELLSSINIDGNASMLIATEATSLDGVELFAILTKSAKTRG